MRARFLLATAMASLVVTSSVSAQAVRTIDPRYVAQAQQHHAQIVQEFGGAETGHGDFGIYHAGGAIF